MDENMNMITLQQLQNFLNAYAESNEEIINRCFSNLTDLLTDEKYQKGLTEYKNVLTEKITTLEKTTLKHIQDVVKTKTLADVVSTLTDCQTQSNAVNNEYLEKIKSYTVEWIKTTT